MSEWRGCLLWDDMRHSSLCVVNNRRAASIGGGGQGVIIMKVRKSNGIKRYSWNDEQWGL